jgi:hypothetical protein
MLQKSQTETLLKVRESIAKLITWSIAWRWDQVKDRGNPVSADLKSLAKESWHDIG